MKWIKKSNPKVGSKRTISKFAIIPITIGKETRWLENVSIAQEWCESGAADIIFIGWINMNFIK